MGEQTAKAPGLNRAKTYQLVLFPLNNGATNVYYVLVLSYIATFGSKVLALSMLFASVMVTGMRLFDAITDPIIGALMDRTNGKFGKFRPFMVIGNLIMAASILALYCLTPLIPASADVRCATRRLWLCTRSGSSAIPSRPAAPAPARPCLTNDPKQRPLFTIFNTVGSLLGMGAMQFFAPILAKNYEGGYASAGLLPHAGPRGHRHLHSAHPRWPSSASGRRISPSTSASAAKRPRKSRSAEYIQIIKEQQPHAAPDGGRVRGCKLALSIATNTTVLCACCTAA